jgi:exopolysaccharide biosynthesis polyprenyl glycosylphosphotransferase
MLSPEVSQKLNRAGDALILVVASFASAMDHGHVHWKVAWVMAATALAFWALASRVLRHYDAWNGRGFLGDLVLTFLLLAAVVVPMVALRALVQRYAVTTELSRFLAVLLPAVLWLRLRVTGLRLQQSRRIDKVLIVGVEALGRLTDVEMCGSAHSRQLVGYLRFDEQVDGARLRAPVLGTIADIEGVLKQHVVDEVYFATSDHRGEVQAAIGVCEKLGVPFALPAGNYRFGRAKCTQAAEDGYLHYLSVPNKPIQLGLKRLVDIALSGLALVALSPLFVVVAIAVKVTSKGPIPFRQERVGLRGRTFFMLKFRSMVANAEELRARLSAANEMTGPVFKMKRDPRVTSLGRFMRKYSIDELPQLINVLRGDMSLVGPRPPLPAEVAQYEAWQRRRLSVRPGLTCVWQVSGRNHISFRDWMRLDMQYIDHWSLAQDIGLILKTIPVVLMGRGAS